MIPHNSENDVEIVIDKLEIPDVRVVTGNMLDRSWLETEMYEAELYESLPLPFVKDKFMAMLSSIHIDLEDAVLDDAMLVEGVLED